MMHFLKFQAAFEYFGWKYPLKLSTLCKQAVTGGMSVQNEMIIVNEKWLSSYEICVITFLHHSDQMFISAFQVMKLSK